MICNRCKAENPLEWNDKSWKAKGPQPWFGRVWMILNCFVLGVRMEKGAILGMRALGKVRAEQGIWISRMAYLRLLLGINRWEDFFIFYQTLAVICLSATWLYSVPYIYIYEMAMENTFQKKIKHGNIYILKEKIK